MIHTAYAGPLYDVAAELWPATSKVWAQLGADDFGYSWKRRMGRYFWSDYFDVDGGTLDDPHGLRVAALRELAGHSRKFERLLEAPLLERDARAVEEAFEDHAFDGSNDR